MATAKDRAQAKAGSGLNDDIGEQKRLALYRSQVRLREAEQRAYDLFLQNLVKGTSHLSLGQEAIAAGFAEAMQKGDLSFCTYRGHAHTLARGVPVEKVLGELMQRDNGLMRGKGGSMHLTSEEHGVMGSSAHIFPSPAAPPGARNTRATRMSRSAFSATAPPILVRFTRR
jgi:pyruvate dehydrogenase E1 component alpha subunit